MVYRFMPNILPATASMARCEAPRGFSFMLSWTSVGSSSPTPFTCCIVVPLTIWAAASQTGVPMSETPAPPSMVLRRKLRRFMSCASAIIASVFNGDLIGCDLEGNKRP